MTSEIEKKLIKLREILKNLKSVLIAYSGGVDSTFLLKVAEDTLEKKNVLAITANSPIHPDEEIMSAKKMAKIFGAHHLIIKTKELKNSFFVRNSPKRCYYCKKQLFAKLTEAAKKEHLSFILDGTNSDDYQDFRPGTRAAKEFKIRTPLEEAKLTKNEIRSLSKRMNLPTWNKPSLTCLATRFPYGMKITEKNLDNVYQAEKFLKNFGIQQVRVRHHNRIARIEVLTEDMSKILKERKKIVSRFNVLGYYYVTVDLEGYRCGSMDEVL